MVTGDVDPGEVKALAEATYGKLSASPGLGPRARPQEPVQRAARRNGLAYHLGGAGALLRGIALVAMGGPRLIRRYDWLYGWKPA